MKRTKMEKGITLIALIITVVLLLILATVAITAMTQYNIIENSNSAAKKYKDVAVTENTLLGDYETELDQYLGGGTIGGSGSIGGNDSENSQGSVTTTAQWPYKIGDEVKVRNESFYVMRNCNQTDTTVLLLAKECINTDSTNLVQSSSASDIKFSSTNYWSRTATSYPYDLTESSKPDASHYALRAAWDYAEKIDKNAIGRLMTYEEANILKDTYGNMIYRKYNSNGYKHYWLGSADDTGRVWYVGGGDLESIACVFSVCGVRPVVEISKSEIY